MKSSEIKENVEMPKIRLELFRHEEKAPLPPGVEKTDTADRELVRISPKGRIQASLVGKSKGANLKRAAIISSPRKRTTETAYREMLGSENIGPDASLEEMSILVNKHILPGGTQQDRKVKVLPGLDYCWNGTPEYEVAANDSYSEGKLMQFLWKKSDPLAQELGDSKSDTYSRFAAKDAVIVKHYFQVFPKWEKVAQWKIDSSEMQRYIPTSQNLHECFLMKVIQSVGGDQEVEEFLNSLKSQNGFEPGEGYSVVITRVEGNLQGKFTFRDKSWVVEEGVIDKIIEESDTEMQFRSFTQ
jgi:hypothetical protein